MLLLLLFFLIINSDKSVDIAINIVMSISISKYI